MILSVYVLFPTLHLVTPFIEAVQDFDWCSITCNGVPNTMCAYKAGGPPSCVGAENGLTDLEKKNILHIHNELRAKVARGEERPQPPASDMNELLWDDELAEVAQRWIEQCQFHLQHDKCRLTKKGETMGQNLSLSQFTCSSNRTSTINMLIKLWYREVNHFHPNLINGNWRHYRGKAIGHYTAMVWASTTHVGCGVYSNRVGNRKMFKLACNYKPAGNVYTGTSGLPVYTVGKTASKCTSKSVRYHGLCSSK